MVKGVWRAVTNFITLRFGEERLNASSVTSSPTTTSPPSRFWNDIAPWSSADRLRPSYAQTDGEAPGLFSRLVRCLETDRRLRFAVVAVCLAVTILGIESRSSWLQSRLFAAVAKQLTYKVEAGADPAGHGVPSGQGPYDHRLGYADLNRMVDQLEAAGYTVESQARSSEWLRRLNSWGLYPVYLEKNQAGLRVLGRDDTPLYVERYPRRAYSSFEEIPPVVVQSLLLIENRELLNPDLPFRNPAVEWDRLTLAAVLFGFHKLQPDTQIVGGSTLATQLEKLRHSPGGVTSSLSDKLRQMGSASLRSYLQGEETLPAQKRIIRDYLNSLPLAAVPNYGEVTGLGDGLEVWYGADVDRINSLLYSRDSAFEGDQLVARAQAYRQVLTLLLAIQKPSFFLVDRRDALQDRVERYLPLAAEQGLISPRVRDLALAASPDFRLSVPLPGRPPFSRRKATDAMRADLLRLLGIDSTYRLDRLDLTVKTTIDAGVQQEVARTLDELRDPQHAAAAGLQGQRLLSRGEPQDVIYSFTLYERYGDANLLLVQADNLDQPLNVNEGVKLELGSTAKLRTLVHYLEIVAELHRELTGLSPEQLNAVLVAPNDNLTRWAKSYLLRNGDTGPSAMLEAAMVRQYSASPAEGFFTGGGLHHFSNFEPQDNGRIMSVREAFHRSVNLVFIRLMRDIVNYHAMRVPGVSPDIFEDVNHPARTRYLTRFADQEGREFLTQFYRKYQGLSRDEALATLLLGARRTQAGILTAYRSVRPKATAQDLVSFLEAHAPDLLFASSDVDKVFDSYGIDRFDLSDRAYLSRVHPLALWLLAQLENEPDATLPALVENSADVRIEVYRWLFRTRHKQAQDKRIRILMETDAFTRIHKAWSRAGFPFDSLVPSYATAIGSSGDRPAALAELMGIIVNDGARVPTVKLTHLHFGEHTPAETVMVRRSEPPQQVLPPEVAELVRRELVGVVEHGTGRRAAGGITLSDGSKLAVGGKTGTGDNRFDFYSSGGRLIGSRVVNRTATFTFLIGDRFFGVITAFVRGPDAASYAFTSALPVQVFKHLVPVLHPVLEVRVRDVNQANPPEVLADQVALLSVAGPDQAPQ